MLRRYGRSERKVLERLKEGNPNRKERFFYSENKVIVTGEIKKELEISYVRNGVTFYKTWIEFKRDNGYIDIIPIVVPDSLVREKGRRNFQPGNWVEIAGVFKSVSKVDKNDKYHLLVYVQVNGINIYKSEHELLYKVNYIYLRGKICREPKLKEIPTVNAFADLLLVVDRPHRMPFIFPCALYGDIAKKVYKKYKINDNFEMIGRLQSRKYPKRLDSKKVRRMITFEAAVKELLK